MSTASEPRTIRLGLTDMAYGGDAVGRDPESGMAVFAWPGITGEEVDVAVTHAGKSMLRGVVSAVHQPSSARVVPPCPYFGSCGGCQWQHMAYEEQVRAKHGILRSQLTRLAGISDPDPVLLTPLASPEEFHYRNTSHFALDPSARALAYYRRETHSLIAVEACPISNAGINRLMPFVNSLLQESGAGSDVALAGTDGKGIMRVWKISIRSSETTGHNVLVFHSMAGGRAQSRPDRHSRRPRRESERDVASPVGDDPGAAHVVSISRREVRRAISSLAKSAKGEKPPGLVAVEVMDDGTVNHLGETRGAGSASSEAVADMLTGALLRTPQSQDSGPQRPPLGAWIENLAGRSYWVGPAAFFQTNTGAAELLLSEVARHVPGKLDLLVDAHAGVGTFALHLAGRAKRVLAFEPDGGSIDSGEWSARTTNTTNVEFRKGRAEELLPRLAPHEKPSAIILDPPRAGCHPSLLAEIARRQIPRLVYVSCDPSTLARDIKILSSSYRLTSARVVDMFPQTYHIETVAVLEGIGVKGLGD
jgi:23S rRNA (uracil1939-C5)-methyltransferase